MTPIRHERGVVNNPERCCSDSGSGHAPGHGLPTVVPVLLADGVLGLIDGSLRAELSKIPQLDCLVFTVCDEMPAVHPRIDERDPVDVA